MTTQFFAFGFAAVLLLTQPPVLLAQDAPGQQDWAAVQAVPSGAELVVETKAGKRVKGKLSNVSDLTLTLVRKNNPVDLDRTDVQRIYRRSDGARTKSALIGAGVGAGLGVGLAFAALHATGGSDEAGDLILQWGSLAAGIGAAVGAVAGSGHKRVLIYDAK